MREKHSTKRKAPRATAPKRTTARPQAAPEAPGSTQEQKRQQIVALLKSLSLEDLERFGPYYQELLNARQLERARKAVSYGSLEDAKRPPNVTFPWDDLARVFGFPSDKR